MFSWYDRKQKERGSGSYTAEVKYTYILAKMKLQHSVQKILSLVLLLSMLALACNLPVTWPATGPQPSAVSSQPPAVSVPDASALPSLSPSPLPPLAPSLLVPTQANGPLVTPVLPGSPSPGTPTLPAPELAGPYFEYAAQSGDTLPALALRFGVGPDQIQSDQPLPAQAYLQPGQMLYIPNTWDAEAQPPAPRPALPDAEIVYSPASLDLDVFAFVFQAGGFLSAYQEDIDGEVTTGPAIVQRVADETSTNPRLLLALLEYQSHWVFGQPAGGWWVAHPVGYDITGREGLYQELTIATAQLGVAYYGWREGTFTELRFKGGARTRLHPALNAGSVAVQSLFAGLYSPEDWNAALYGPSGFLAFYARTFGDPWARAANLGSLLPPGLAQPSLELPFLPGTPWSFSAGPHRAWNAGSALGALDFAPVTGQAPCTVSTAWASAAAPGVVVRSDHNALVLDLDGDRRVQTGWALFYFHLADEDRQPTGAELGSDDPLGHPSCQGGSTTGTHLHFARRYNGEWIPADGPVPFVLGGWTAHQGARIYQGTLSKGDQIISSNPSGPRTALITR